MSTNWDDEYLTVREIAEHLKLNQQTLRNWIDAGSLPAVRIGRRVRVRRVDLERILAEGTTSADEPEPMPVTSADPVEAREQLALALERTHRLLGRRSAARRTEPPEALQDLTDAAAAALPTLSNDSGEPTSDAPNHGDADSPEDAA